MGGNQRCRNAEGRGDGCHAAPSRFLGCDPGYDREVPVPVDGVAGHGGFGDAGQCLQALQDPAAPAQDGLSQGQELAELGPELVSAPPAPAGVIDDARRRLDALTAQFRLSRSELLRRAALNARLPDAASFAARESVHDLLRVNTDLARLGNLFKLALDDPPSDALARRLERLAAAIDARLRPRRGR